MKTTTNHTITAALVAAFLCLPVIGAVLDRTGPSDIAAAQAQAEWLAEAQRIAAIETLARGASTEATARAACAQLHGPAHRVFQTPEGDWVCRGTTHGLQLAAAE